VLQASALDVVAGTVGLAARPGARELDVQHGGQLLLALVGLHRLEDTARSSFSSLVHFEPPFSFDHRALAPF